MTVYRLLSILYFLAATDGNYVNHDSEPDRPTAVTDGEMRRPLWTPAEIKSMPRGLQLISGVASNTTFYVSNSAVPIFWSCGGNGHTFKDSDGKK